MLTAFIVLWLTVTPVGGCTTDTDCAERFGGNGSPEPALYEPVESEWDGDTCAGTDEGCPS